MRKLPQEFAFPLGLGSKKHTAISDAVSAAGMSVGAAASTPAMAAAAGQKLQTALESGSERAPCQDLDTINL